MTITHRQMIQWTDTCLTIAAGGEVTGRIKNLIQPIEKNNVSSPCSITQDSRGSSSDWLTKGDVILIRSYYHHSFPVQVAFVRVCRRETARDSLFSTSAF
jgi:hypothetical protein